jgi:hypothetical protein
MSYALAAFVALLLTATAPASADDRVETQGEVIYSIPDGWERVEQEGIVVLTPKDVPPDQCALVVTSGETLPPEGNFERWFKAKWDALRKESKVIQGGQRTGNAGPKGSTVLYQAALLNPVVGDESARTGLMLYAVHIGDAVHWVVFKTNGAKLFNEHKKTVNTFLAGLKFSETKVETKSNAKPAGPADPRSPAKKPRSDRAQPPEVLKADPD